MKSLEDVVAYTRRRGEILPQLRNETVIEPPGLSDDDLAKVCAALPDLPESYLSVLRKVNLVGITIGYFELSPFLSRTKGIAGTLRVLNDMASNPMVRHFQKARVYQVAAWEADPICVAGRSSALRPGRVVWYASGTFMEPTAIADDFEQYLVLAAMLDSVRAKNKEKDKSAVAMKQFSQDLREQFGALGELERNAWERIAKVVLGS